MSEVQLALSCFAIGTTATVAVLCPGRRQPVESPRSYMLGSGIEILPDAINVEGCARS